MFAICAIIIYKAEFRDLSACNIRLVRERAKYSIVVRARGQPLSYIHRCSARLSAVH